MHQKIKPKKKTMINHEFVSQKLKFKKLKKKIEESINMIDQFFFDLHYLLAEKKKQSINKSLFF